MTRDALDVLRERNPYTDELRAAPIEALLERLVAEPTRRSPHRRVRARPSLLAAAATACVLAVLVVLVGNPGDDGFDVAAAVYRVTAPGTGMVHIIVTETTTTDLTGRRAVRRSKVESWAAPRHDRLHTIQTDGTLSFEEAVTGHRQQQWHSTSPRRIETDVLPRVIGHPSDPVSALRRDLKLGRVRVIGRATINGRRVWRLYEPVRTSALKSQPPGSTLMVDARTFIPLQLVSFGAARPERNGPWVKQTRVVTRYLVYERMPYNASNRRLLEMTAHLGHQTPTP
jgi:hypothetical protein